MSNEIYEEEECPFPAKNKNSITLAQARKVLRVVDAGLVRAAASYASVFQDQILTIAAGCCLDALREVDAPGIKLMEELGL